MICVMADEVIDPWFVISLGVAFLIGLLSIFIFFWFRSTYKKTTLKSKSGEMTGSERLEYYERQLIDMKIRLDALEIIQNTNNSSKNVPDEQAITTPALVAGLAQLLSQISEKSGAGEEVRTSHESKKETQDDVISVAKEEAKEADREDFVPKIEFSAYPNPIDHVLHLITNNITTSRDIQTAMKKSREHTSRLLKKMYEDGYLQRDKNNRPYTYSITEKGTKRLQQNSNKK